MWLAFSPCCMWCVAVPWIPSYSTGLGLNLHKIILALCKSGYTILRIHTVDFCEGGLCNLFLCNIGKILAGWIV